MTPQGRAPEPAAYEPEPPPPPAEALRRHGARLLDPTVAVRLPGGASPRATAYVADTLLVAGGASRRDAIDVLADVAKRQGFGVRSSWRCCGGSGRGRSW